MKNSGETPPSDLPKVEIVAKANQVIAQGGTVFFKVTCAHCDERICLAEANTWYDDLECCKCGLSFHVDKAGMMVLFGGVKL